MNYFRNHAASAITAFGFVIAAAIYLSPVLHEGVANAYSINVDGSACENLTFPQARAFGVTQGTYDVVSADFDSDGRTDLASGSSVTNKVSVLRNIGGQAGTLSFASFVEFTIGSGTLALSVADLNGDGKPDIVASNFSNSTVSVLLNLSTGPGLISFAPKVDFAVGGEPRSVAIADFDNDSKPDIAVLNGSSNSISVLRNNTAIPTLLGFDPPISLTIPTVTSQPRSLDTGDLDGDGKPDIAVASNINSGIVSIFRNATTAGISFANRIDISLNGFPAQILKIGDLDGDAKSDLSIASFDLPFVATLRNTSPAAGSVGFAALQQSYVGYFSSAMTMTDLDGDGKRDLAVSSTLNNVSVLRNAGAPGTISLEPRKEFGVGQLPRGITAADLDGNGRPDLATSNNGSSSVSLLRNTGSNGFPISFDSRLILALDISASTPLSTAIGDLDSDGRPEILTANNTSSNFSVLQNLGRVNGKLSFGSSVQFSGAPSSEPYAIAVGDLDSDGKKDVVITNAASLGSISIFRNTSTTTGSFQFGTRMDIAVGVQPRDLVIADLNNDGKLDLVALNTNSDNFSVLGNTTTSPGAISFSAPVNYAVNSRPSSIVAVDLDGDGLREIVATNFIGTTISVLRNSSSPGGPIQFLPKIDFQVNLNPFSVSAADFDRDGKQDLAVANRTSAKAVISVFRNTSVSIGSITFAAYIDFDVDTNQTVQATIGRVASGNLDGDARPDIAAINPNNGQFVAVLRNTTTNPGQITFAPRENVDITGVASDLRISDVNGDGKLDLVHSSYNSNTVGILLNPCGLSWPTEFDYDGDGRSDLSTYRQSNRFWHLLRGTAGYMSMEFGVAGDLLAPADYDGDAKTDIAMFRPSNGTWYFFNSESQSFSTVGWGANGDLPVPADHDGDGKADLVVFRPSTNTWYTRFSLNNTFSTIGFGVSGDKPVVGDFDGDGRADIALFRPSNSSWYILKTGFGFFIQTWGQTGDIPVPADYDGDGATDVAVFRPSTGQWFRIRSTSGFDIVNWGANGDRPIPADYDGDGMADVAVFRSSNSTWYIVGSQSGQLIQQYGVAGDVPTQGAFIY